MSDHAFVSIVCPVFNEEKGIPIFYQELCAVIDALPFKFEVIFVNDGSTDSSFQVLGGLHDKDARVKIMDLSRNFGHQNALTAGLDLAAGDAVIMMDTDMEDEPQAIRLFLEHWQQGYDVVYARRGQREVSWPKRMLFKLFHKINAAVSDIKLDAAGIFCLMDRKVVDQLRMLVERDRYLPGLRAWVGYQQIGLEVPRRARYDHSPRVGTGRLFKLAFDSFFSFSTLPLKLSVICGLMFSIVSFCSIIYILYQKFFTINAIPGWASILSTVLLVGGVQLICIGLQGEYLIRIFNEVKDRPNYIVRKKIGFGP